MILEVVVLGGVLLKGYKSWHKQEYKHNTDVLNEQEKNTQNLQRVPKNEKRTQLVVPKKRSSLVLKRQFVSASVAILLSGAGTLFYYPLIFLSVPFIVYSVRRKFIIAWQLAKEGKIDLETLVAVSLTGAILGQKMLIASLLAMVGIWGDRLSRKTVNESKHDLVDVFDELPKEVWALKDDVEISLPLSDIQVGDTLVVGAGEVIPADGSIIKGTAGINQHHFTGEAIPVEKSIGDEVFATTIVLSGKIFITVEKEGAESNAMQIAGILNDTAEYQSLTALRAERFSRQLVKPAVITAGIAFPLLGFGAAVGTIMSHPKDRLRISAPISLLKYLKQGRDEGILIKDGRSLELLRKVDTIVFDKTGTLTEEQPSIYEIYSYGDLDSDLVLSYAAAAEFRQKHPLAVAIVEEAERRGLELPVPEHSEYLIGYGVKVTVDGSVVLVGSLRYIHSEGVVVPEEADNLESRSAEMGHGIIMVARNGELIGAIELRPTIRPEAKAVIQQLKKQGQIKKTYIISGDSEIPTQHLAQQLGIDEYFAQALPKQKADIIKNLQEQGAFVCFIGDGINDAIAMKQAQVSVSLNGASQLATDTAQILFLNQGISHLPRLFELAHGFHRHMDSQLRITFGASILGISGVFLGGWGMSKIMVVNITSILTSLGYSLFDKPTAKSEIQRIDSPKEARGE